MHHSMSKVKEALDEVVKNFKDAIKETAFGRILKAILKRDKE